MIAIVIVHWGSPKITLECMQSVRSCLYPNAHIIVVDNCPEQRLSWDELDIDHFATYIQSTTNTGYSGGNNVGIQKAKELRAKYILLLNNDAILDSAFLHTCVGHLERHPKISVISPKILFYHAPEYINTAGGELNLNTGEKIVFGENEKNIGQCEIEKEITWATGCAFFARARIFKEIGLFDENLFCYCEDDDISRRIILKKFKMLYLPGAIVLHKHSYVRVGTQGGLPSKFLMYYYWRNRLYNLRRYFPASFGTAFIRFGGIFIWSLVACALKHRRPDLSMAMLLGLFDLIAGRMGKRDYNFIRHVSDTQADSMYQCEEL